ncbi:MAG: PilZ domain-containing protein [Polyangiaceae bacterium]
MKREPTEAALEKRQRARAALDVDVEIRLDDETSHRGYARDISIGGMFVEAELDVPFGANVLITLLFPKERALCALPATVRWSTAHGFGIQFKLLGVRETYAITEATRQANLQCV